MMNYTDNFDKAEIKNRPAAVKVLKKLCVNHPNFDGWEFKETNVTSKDRYDFGLEKDGKKILVEHKARTYNKNRFRDGQLDGNKYDHLIGLIGSNDVVGVFYINTFLDGCAIGNIKKKIGERRGSAPHYEKTVVDSDLTYTYDMYYRLEEAAYIE